MPSGKWQPVHQVKCNSEGSAPLKLYTTQPCIC